MQQNLFDDAIRKAWWDTTTELIKDGLLKSGTDYLIENDFLYISFTNIHMEYIRHLVKQGKPREWIVVPGEMRRLLIREPDYVYDIRKRLSDTVNVRVMVFLWNKQVRLPGRKLRKVS